MKKFEIHYTHFETIEAESFEQAKEFFINKHPIPTAQNFYDIDSGESKDVIATCEISNLPIFVDDDYKNDSEGCYWLTSQEELYRKANYKTR